MVGLITRAPRLTTPAPKFAWQAVGTSSLKRVRGNEFYRRNGTKLEKSTDYGRTWAMLHDFAPASPEHVWKNPSRADHPDLLVWAGEGGLRGKHTLYHSSDDATFTVVLEDVYAPFEPFTGIASNGDTLVYGEYTTAGDDHRLLRSVDRGKSWEVVQTNAPATSRHWHSALFDKWRKRWLVTTGDDDGQINWYVAPVAADAFTRLALTYDQRYRTLVVDAITPDEYLWVSDGDFGQYAAIYAARADNLEQTTVLTPMSDEAAITYVRHGEVILVGTWVDPKNPVKVATLIGSFDGGRSWGRLGSWPLTLASGGFHSTLGVDDRGRVWLATTGISKSQFEYLTVQL